MKADEFEIKPCSLDVPLPDYLYTNPAFVTWQAETQGKKLQSFGVFRKNNQQLYGRLTFAGSGDVWRAPVTGTFGGPVFYKHVPVACIDALFIEASRWLRDEANAKACYVRLPPTSFPDPALALTCNALYRCGWAVDQVDINYHLPVVPVEEFHASLGATKKQETRRLKSSGAAFTALSLDRAKLVYDVIARNRAARGYPMTMTWEALSAVAQTFPSHFHFYAVMRGDDVLAGAICIEVTPTYMYVFYWGEDPGFRREMPVLLVVDGLVSTCHQKGMSAIDIGISTEKSAPNEGLIEFKTGLGFLSTPKITFRRDF